MEEEANRLLVQVARHIRRYRANFLLSSLSHYAICIGAITCPLLMGSGILQTKWLPYVGIAAAFCSGVASWSKLGTVVTIFGEAFTELEIARQAYYLDNDAAKLLQSLSKAKRGVISWIPGIPADTVLGRQPPKDGSHEAPQV